MSRFEIKMPKLGESITEGTILSWSVKVGDTVQEDDVLFEVNTAKVSAEIPSPVAGKVVEIMYKEGDTVPVGTVVAIVDMEGEEDSEETSGDDKVAQTEEAAEKNKGGAATASPAETTSAPVSSSPSIAESASSSVSSDSSTSTSPSLSKEEKEVPKAMAAKTEEGRWYSPVVLQLAQAAHLSKEELDTIPGTGYQGRLSKKDIKNYIAKKEKGDTAPAKPASTVQSRSSETSPVSGSTSAGTSNAAPGAASTASGSSSSRSVSSAASSGSGSSASNSSTSSLSSSDAGSQEGVEVKEMDRVRKMIADHMVMSKHTSPHVTNVVEVDMTKPVKWRTQNKDSFFRREGVKLTYMPLITEAVAKALSAYPQVNVSVEGYNILFKKHINIGIAVSLNDGNLIVPVVHDADRLNLNGLAVAIDSLAAKARANKLMPDDISGGTFTITNFGTFKSLFGTPIINQPQVAILGVGYIEKKPAVIETPEGDVIAIRPKMYLSLSYDHRVVDGMLAGQFLYAIKEYLENWDE